MPFGARRLSNAAGARVGSINQSGDERPPPPGIETGGTGDGVLLISPRSAREIGSRRVKPPDEGATIVAAGLGDIFTAPGARPRS
jgi:hypothetical protein